jgi:hypothetical protein
MLGISVPAIALHCLAVRDIGTRLKPIANQIMIVIRGGTITINREITACHALAILVHDAEKAIFAAVAATTTIEVCLVTIHDLIGAVRRGGFKRRLRRGRMRRIQRRDRRREM